MNANSSKTTTSISTFKESKMAKTSNTRNSFFAGLNVETANLPLLETLPVSVNVLGVASTAKTMSLGRVSPVQVDGFGMTQIIPSTVAEGTKFTLANHDSDRPMRSWWTDTEILALHSAAEALDFNWTPIQDPGGQPYGRFFVAKRLPKNGQGIVALFHILTAPVQKNGRRALPPFALALPGGHGYYSFPEMEIPTPKSVALKVHGESINVNEEWFKVEALNFTSARIVRIPDATDSFGMDFEDLQQVLLHEFLTYGFMTRLVDGEKFHCTIYTPTREGTNEHGRYSFVDMKLFLKAAKTVQRVSEMTLAEALKDRNASVQNQRDYRRQVAVETRMVEKGAITVAYEPTLNEEGEQVGAHKVYGQPGVDQKEIPSTLTRKDTSFVLVKLLGQDWEIMDVNDVRIRGTFQGVSMDTNRPSGKPETIRNAGRVQLMRSSHLKLEQTR